MAYRCGLCGKGRQYGYKVSHAKNRTKRVFKPNLHRVRILVAGQTRKMYLCTKCLRSTKVKPTPAQETKATAPAEAKETEKKLKTEKKAVKVKAAPVPVATG